MATVCQVSRSSICQGYLAPPPCAATRKSDRKRPGGRQALPVPNRYPRFEFADDQHRPQDNDGDRAEADQRGRVQAGSVCRLRVQKLCEKNSIITYVQAAVCPSLTASASCSGGGALDLAMLLLALIQRVDHLFPA